MTARDRILERIRRTAPTEAPPRPVAPVPALAQSEGPARVERFVEKALATDATLTRLPGWEDLPQALAEELRARNLPAAIRTGTDPAFERDWGGVERSIGPGRIEEPAALSRAPLAIAETGTLALFSGPENPVTLTFLAETHFIALEAGDICAGLEEMWQRFRAIGADPRTVNLVTGPSRSADIGQTLQLGAHGPVALHIFLIG